MKLMGQIISGYWRLFDLTVLKLRVLIPGSEY